MKLNPGTLVSCQTRLSLNQKDDYLVMKRHHNRNKQTKSPRKLRYKIWKESTYNDYEQVDDLDLYLR